MSVHPGDGERMPPSHLGPVRLLEQLGAGSMGTVYRAELCQDRDYASAGAAVAVKLIHPALLGDATSRERFEREAELGIRVEHEAVVRTYESGRAASDGATFHFLVQELVEGRSLRAWMEELGPLPDALLRDVGRQLARGLAAVHAAGAVHRDVKPDNILITPRHAVKLLDLGVAALRGGRGRLTSFGRFAGSPLYAAPEQFHGADIGPRADLYALGVVLYEAASGRHPFAADDLPAIMRRQLEETPPPVERLNPRLSPLLASLISRLLEKSPGRRFGSATELADALELGERSPWWTNRERDDRAGPRPALGHIRVARRTPVRGRDAELRRLEAWIDELRRGTGRFVLITGEAGVGKTRLVDRLVERTAGSTPDVGVLYGSNSPGRASGQTGALAQALVEHVDAEGMGPALARYLVATPRLVPVLAAYLLARTPPVDCDPLTPESLPTALGELARALVAERPLLWIVEDLHYDSAGGRSLLLSLGRIAAEQPLLLVATTRPGLPAEELAELARLPACEHFQLARLSAQAVAQLVADTLGAPDGDGQLSTAIATSRL